MFATPRSRAPASRTATPVPSSGSARRPRSSLLAGRSSLGGRRTSGLATPTAAPSGSSLLTSSQVLEETSRHTLSVPPNSSSPVLVAEILTLADKPSDVSVALSRNGWSWLVHGRRLLVWRHRLQPGARSLGSCRELTLPASDLAHDAKLVNVFNKGGAVTATQTPSCLAVSPEGTIRFWPTIAHESSYVEINADLQGQECCSLTDIQPVGSLLATTTSSVVLIYLTESSGPGKDQNAIACRMLKIPQGILGGIGRRVSSLLWGNVGTGIEAKLVKVLGETYSGDDEEKSVFVLTANSLQKWLLIKDEPDKMYYSCEIETVARSAFVATVWARDTASPSWLRIWLMDMQFAGNKVHILMAAVNPQVSQEISYALGTILVNSEAPPMQFSSFCVFKHTETLPDGNDEDNGKHFAYRFLMPPGEKFAYVYNKEGVLCFSVLHDNEEPDKLDFKSSGNAILGAGSSDSGTPQFFTINQGLVAVAPNSQTEEHVSRDVSSRESSNVPPGSATASRLSESLSISMSKTALDDLTLSESQSDQLKAAFLLFCKRNMGQCTSIIEDLFPSFAPSESFSTIDCSLDKLVLSMSKDLIDDLPASDPRWMETLPESETFATGSIGSTMSLVIVHQLEDKQTALEFYISFLQDVGLWQKLSAVTVRELPMSTRLVLTEHVEKTAAAIALRQIHSAHQTLVDRAIRLALRLRDRTFEEPQSESERGLTPQDHFYRQISAVEDIFEGLQAAQEEAKSPVEVVSSVMAVNKIMVAILRSAHQTRERKLSEFSRLESDTSSALPDFEYLPWTSSLGPRGLRTLLINQFRTTTEKAFSLAEDSSSRLAMATQLADLTDLVLDGYRTQLQKVSGGEDRKRAVTTAYERDRKDMIMALVNRGYHSEAASLAEKYLEFVALIAICEAAGDLARLRAYMERFAEYGMAEFVYEWHVREGKAAKLLTQEKSFIPKKEGEGQEKATLRKFLGRHDKLSWLHDMSTTQWSAAADTLETLADRETERLSRKKTMLSLSKLARLASDDTEENLTTALDAVEHRLNVVSAQEHLPNKVLEAMGFERKDMRVFTPREIIELYIGDDNVDSDHLDFKYALNLLDYVDGEDAVDRDKLRLRIFANAALKDDWASLDVDNPLDAVRETVLYRLLELCYVQGMSLEDLPKAEQLFDAEELRKLRKDVNFRFLVKSGYEHLERVAKQDDEKMDEV